MRRAIVESGASTLFLIVSGLAFSEALTYRGESGLMPKAVTLALAALSALWLLQSLRALRRADGPVLEVSGLQLRDAAILLIAGLALFFGMTTIGIFTTSAVVVPVLAYTFGYRNWVGLVFGTVLFLVLLIGVFRLLLSVALPPELLITFLRG